MKKPTTGLVLGFIAGLVVAILPALVFAAEFVPISGKGGGGPVDLFSASSLMSLLNKIYLAGVGAVAVLAVLMIIWGSIEVVGESVIKVGDGKKRIWNAVWGLLLALGSLTILSTISTAFRDAQFLSENNWSETDGAIVGIDENGQPIYSDGSVSNVPGGATGGAGSNDASVAANSLAGMTFPDQSWNDYALQQVREAGLMSLSPSDAARFFPNGQPTEQGYVSLLAAIANKESGFNPNDTFYEPRLGYNSVGLLSLSAVDSAARAYGYSEQDLKDPLKNIQVGVDILKKQLQTSGKIGSSSYWSTLQ